MRKIPIDKKWLREQYEKGKSPYDLADELGCSHHTIRRRLKEIGIDTRSHEQAVTAHLPKAYYKDKDWLFRRYVYEKQTQGKIAAEAGCSPSTIRNWLRQHNIRRRSYSEAQRLRDQRGENHPNWKGGITPLYHTIRNCPKYGEWRLKVYERDGFTCQWCGASKSGTLQCDHVYPFIGIVNDHDIKTLEQALNCDPLWDISNGRTLCESCHQKTPSFGAADIHAARPKRIRRMLDEQAKYQILEEIKA